MNRLVVVAPLKPGSEARARALLDEGPPIDLESSRFDVHEVFVTAQEVIFLFEGGMAEGGTIRGFTVARGDLRRYFITVFMDTPQFDAFEAFLQAHAEVESASKIAGEGCYQVTLACESDTGLDDFTQALLRYGRYKVASEMRRVKP